MYTNTHYQAQKSSLLTISIINNNLKLFFNWNDCESDGNFFKKNLYENFYSFIIDDKINSDNNNGNNNEKINLIKFNKSNFYLLLPILDDLNIYINQCYNYIKKIL